MKAKKGPVPKSFYERQMKKMEQIKVIIAQGSALSPDQAKDAIWACTVASLVCQGMAAESSVADTVLAEPKVR